MNNAVLLFLDCSLWVLNGLFDYTDKQRIYIAVFPGDA